MKNKLSKFLMIAVSLAPISVFAQYLTQSSGIFLSIQQIVSNLLIPIVFSLALLYFFYGVAKYIRSDAASGKEEGRQIMIWGVVALFVMSSIWGLVAFIQKEFSLDISNTNMQVPTINVTGN